ncbi:hypothetical protein Cgig2_028151 [Carnegiea gigantea]|uniref:Uncharacterized protein n=1 Tax=Carnegiea gigantea TaxID=171969 RepID=A0A9Q1JZ79_9CARY|nr:hypothetical protein Cgig2_028151 [Carnegiea gigantea]
MNRKRRPWRRIPKRLVLHIISHALSAMYKLTFILTMNYKSYYNGVEFRGKRCKDRWFPTAIHWTTDTFEERNKAEKYGRGKIVITIDYQKIIHKSEIKLQTSSTHLAQENQAHTARSASTHGSLPAHEQPCPECGRCLCNISTDYRSVRSSSSRDMRSNERIHQTLQMMEDKVNSYKNRDSKS